jgi:hypothetical protein
MIQLLDWEATMDKDTWEMDDYRKMATMAVIHVRVTGARSIDALLEGLQTKNSGSARKSR